MNVKRIFPLILLPLVALTFGAAFFWWTFLQSDDVHAQNLVPPHLSILSATIEELPPIDPTNVASRKVRLRLELSGTPTCTSTSSFLAYGFLIDADKNTATGVQGEAFADLGVDARVSAECDPATSTFVSPVGSVHVTINPVTGVTLIEILTTIGLLPSVDFRWIAFAQEDTRFTRFPPIGHGAWTTLERAMP